MSGMKDELISFEIAKLSERAGFDEPCIYGYYNLEEGHKKNGQLHNWMDAYSTGTPRLRNTEIGGSSVTAPTQSLLQRWLREVHDIHILIIRVRTIHGPRFQVNQLQNGYIVHVEDIITMFVNYEEALESSLLSSLNLLLKIKEK